MPVLAASGDRLALVTVRGEYDSKRVVVRLADARPQGAVVRVLAAAQDIELPAADPDAIAAPTATFGDEGLVVAYNHRRIEGDEATPRAQQRTTEMRVVRVAKGGRVHDGTIVRVPEWGSSGAHRMAAVRDGIALLAQESSAGEPQIVLVLLSPDGAEVRSRTVLARRLKLGGPSLAAAADGSTVAAAWYDETTDGIWVAFARNDGSRLGPAMRVDRPELRQGRDAPVIVPGPKLGQWRVFWREKMSTFVATIAQP
jgi:hypothetical protein